MTVLGATAVGSEKVLGVEASVGGRRWLGRAVDERAATALVQRFGIPDVVGRVLASRGIGLEEVDRFLRPTLREMLPDPGGLKGMDAAAERISSAVMAGEQIAVFGDYDVDGATSSALLLRFFAAIGGRCRAYIPDRMREGYGPNSAALLKLREEGISLVITVDCGTSATEPLTEARNAGLDIVVVDHHEAEADLPPAIAIVNPNRLDDDFPHGQLAAVGVAFLLVVAVNRALRAAHWYASRPEPDLLQWLDLVALGTVCDVVPLTGINRALVAQGLKVMGQRRNAGLRALADVAGLDEAPGTYHAGFVLGPRVNAGGRVGECDLGTRLLSTDDPEVAAGLARRLNDLNRERQEIEAHVLEDALARLEGRRTNSPIVFAVGEGWHPGVIGIVASRLKERFNRPAVVVALDGDTGTGSGRSVPGVDLGAAVIAARQAGVLRKGGGHSMAAGFTVARDRLDDAETFLGKRIADGIGDAPLVPTLYVDGAVKTGAATADLLQALAMIEPFGSGNPEPRFVVPAARIPFSKQAGDEHVRCVLTDDSGGKLNAIAFRCFDSELGRCLLDSAGAPLHVAGRLRMNTWRGRSTPQLLIDDVARVW